MSTPTHDPVRIPRDIQEWSPDEQLALAQRIMRMVAHLRELQHGQAPERPQAARVPSSTLRGLLANGQPAPSEEEVARWLDEARLEQYGG